MIQSNQIEQTKAGFSRDAFLAARQKTWDAVAQIAKAIHVGMYEDLLI